MNFEYYYNDVPGKGLCRNNLIYTSLISKDKEIFCQWYHNDTTYHKGMNKVIDPNLMEEKWSREVKYLTLMAKHYPQHVPEILDINETEQKIYLRVQGPDMWERAGCIGTDYSSVIPDWQEQIIEIEEAHKSLEFHKFSFHPSSYFLIDGKLKCINYFFCYDYSENVLRFKDIESHISEDRLESAYALFKKNGIDVSQPMPLNNVQKLVFESFRSNYSSDFIQRMHSLY
jgi:hypothetical protein